MTKRYMALIILMSFLIHNTPVHAGDPPSTPIRFPVQIVKNMGQWPASVRYVTLPARNRIIFLEDGIQFIREKRQATELKLPIETGAVNEEPFGYEQAILRFVDPSPRMRIEEDDVSKTVMHFYVGDTSRYRENVPCLQKVTYENVWDGVDIQFDTDGNSLRQGIATTGVSRIGAGSFTLEGDPALVSELERVFAASGSGISIRGSVSSKAESTVSKLIYTLNFRMPERIPTDSVYLWTEFNTYFSGEDGGILNAFYLRVDIAGRVTFEGGTRYGDLPVTANAYQPGSNLSSVPPNTWQISYLGRMNCDGVTPDYLTYYGLGFPNSGGGNSGPAIIGSNGIYIMNAILFTPEVLGFYSPVGDALQYKFPLDTALIHTNNSSFVLSRFDTTGVLIYRSVLSIGKASGTGFNLRMQIGNDGFIYIVGLTFGSLPYVRTGVFMDSFQGSRSRPFVLKLTPECDSVVYCTYLPDSTHVHDVGADADGFASVVGVTTKTSFPMKNALQPFLRDTVAYGDLFIARLSPVGDSLIFSTFLGGSYYDSDNYDYWSSRICVSDAGDIYIAEVTRSDNFPLFRPFQSTYRWATPFVRETDMVIAGFRPDGSIIFSTYWGGDNLEVPFTMDITPCGDLLITGWTMSRDFPVVNPPPYQDSFSAPGWLNERCFMLLIDPENVELQSSFLFPWPYGVYDLHYTNNGYLHRIGFAFDGFPVFNGFQDKIHSPSEGTGISRIYYPLCGEDLLRSYAAIQDTIIVDSVRGYISHYIFDLEIELRNIDTYRSAIMVRSTIELPKGLILQHGEVYDKLPVPSIIPPGGSAFARWRVQLDTAEIGGWAGLRDLLLLVKFTNEYQLSTATESCLTSFSFTAIPLVVKRDDSEVRVACAVTAPDTLRVRADRRGYDPALLPVFGEVRNTGTANSPPGVASLRFGRMGPVTEPTNDTLRAFPKLLPGETQAMQWSMKPARRADTRRVQLSMVLSDERGELTRCTHEIIIPGLRPLLCNLSMPDTILIMKDGTTRPKDILAQFRLENVLDTLVSAIEARIDLSAIGDLALAPGESADRLWSYLQGGRDVLTNWQLRISGDIRVPRSMDVPVLYRCVSDTTWRRCMKSIVLYPLNSDLFCTLGLPSTLTASEVESRTILNLDYTLSNVGTVPVDVDRLELAIAPANAGLSALDPITLTGTLLNASGSLPWSVRLRASILRTARNANCTVTAFGTNASGGDTVLSVCSASIAIEGVDGLRCAITAPDSVRFERDSLRYIPDPVPVRIDLSNVLDTEETVIEAGIDLANAPRFELAAGENALKTLARIDSHATAMFTWLLSPQSGSADETQDIRIRYRSTEQGVWKECNTTIIIEAWPEVAEVRCATGGHDSLHADQAYEDIVPKPFQVSYTATNSGTVTLTSCTAAIILPVGFACAGSDSIQSYGSLAPGELAKRWWTLTTTDQLTTFGPKDIQWQWSSDEQGIITGCAHTVQVVPNASGGIVFTPLHLYFEAEMGGTLPAAQNINLWTGGGLSMPWTAQSDTWYIDLDPVAGDHAATIAVRPNTTMLNKGMHESGITLAGSAQNLPKSIDVLYMITSLTGTGRAPTPSSLSLGPIYPHPIPLQGEARMLITAASGSTARITLHDLLGRERALLHDGVMTDGEVLILRPTALGLEPGCYLLRLLSPNGMQSRMVTVVR